MNNEIPAEAVEKMKREGWPSIEAQEKYWEEKDRQVHTALSAALYDEWKNDQSTKVIHTSEDVGDGYERYNLEQTEATCDWFDSRCDGHGESNAERNR